MLKLMLCLFFAAVLGGTVSVIWWGCDDEVPMKYLLLPPYAVFGLLWLVIPDERPRDAIRRR